MIKSLGLKAKSYLLRLRKIGSKSAPDPANPVPEQFNRRNVSRYVTASSKNIALFGKKFIRTFPKEELKGKKRQQFSVSIVESHYESETSAAIQTLGLGKTGINSIVLAEARLGFADKVVVIEALQGHKGRQASLERFRQMHKSPWANYLIGKIEANAKKNGFKIVAIRAPESIYYYQEPFGVKDQGEIDEMQDRVKSLYEKTAKAMGYKKNGAFFVKELR